MASFTRRVRRRSAAHRPVTVGDVFAAAMEDWNRLVESDPEIAELRASGKDAWPRAAVLRRLAFKRHGLKSGAKP